MLKGIEDQLLKRNIIGIEVEIEFIDYYKKQPLFDQIFQFLFQRGFHLFDLRPIYWRTKYADGNYFSKSQLIWADALFLKNIVVNNDVFSQNQYKMKMIKYIIILILYGYFDQISFILLHNKQYFSNEEIEELQKLLRILKLKKNIKFKGKYYIVKYLEKILNKLDPASDLKLFHWDNYTQVGKYLGNKIHY